MAIHLRDSYDRTGVPFEFIKLALSNLESAERLNQEMVEGRWASNYYRGQSVLLLAFHATELFLKGFILKLSPDAKMGSHSVQLLLRDLKRLAPAIELSLPFNVEALPPYPELVRQAEASERRFHEMIRYPIDREGNPWSGVRGFSSEMFAHALRQIRSETERVYVHLFGGEGDA